MSQGIIYYNRGSKCLIRLLVSLSSLRRSGYSGPVTVMVEEPPPDWWRRLASTELGAVIMAIPPRTCANVLGTKAKLWRWTPYARSLFIDSDTLVVKDPSPIFDLLGYDPDVHGFAVARFTNWQTGGRRIAGRIRGWHKVAGDLIPAALSYGPAINTGVFAFDQGHPLLPHWEQLCEAGQGEGDVMGRTLDELACQLLIPRYGHALIGQEWCWSINYGLGDPSIVHFHGGKHVLKDKPLCAAWLDEYWRLRLGRGPAVHAAMGDPMGDRRLTQLLDGGSPRVGPGIIHRDLTICCAADPAYMPKFLKHFDVWMRTPGLREQQFLFFALNAPATDKAYDPLVHWPNVRIAEYRQEGVSPREAAFSAFVYGVAANVTTPYFLKLDGDSVVRGPFVWPRYDDATIVADPWHYTRVKGDPGATEHWLNKLDAMWKRVKGEPPIFPQLKVKERHRHRRIRSYCMICRTDFARRIAAMFPSRLPVPSQDTTFWYVATRLGIVVKRHPFRRYITA